MSLNKLAWTLEVYVVTLKNTVSLKSHADCPRLVMSPPKTKASKQQKSRVHNLWDILCGPGIKAYGAGATQEDWP